MKPVLIFPRGTLTAKDRERLSRNGIVGIEADDPSKVVCQLPGTLSVSDSDIAMAALSSINDEFDVKGKFFENFMAIYKARIARPPADQGNEGGKK